MLFFKANWTMLKIWSELMFNCLCLHYSLKLWSSTQLTFIPLHFESFQANRIMLKIWSDWMFDHLYLRYASKLWPTTPSLCCILLYFEDNGTMLKNWSEFIFDHSYLCYSSRLYPTIQRTFILLHFALFWGKSDNAKNLVGIYLKLVLPPLFFTTMTNHSVYLSSAAFHSLFRQFRQWWSFGEN